MIPSSIAGLLLAVAALSPGYVYIRFASSRRPRAERSALMETGEFLLWGTATSGAALLLVFVGAHLGVPFLIDLREWSSGGSNYLAEDPWRAVWSGATAFAIASLLALTAAYLVYRKTKTRVVEEPVWWSVFGGRPPKSEVFCSVQTTAGPVLEGFLYAYTTHSEEPRDIALKPPLWLWQDGLRHSVAGIDRVVIAGHQVREIDVRFVDSG